MVHQFSWWIAYNLIIITILILYIRIFPKTWLHKTSIWVGILITVWSILNAIIIIFQCTPVRYFWDKSESGGHCIQANQYYAAAAAISMIMIIAVFCLPLPILLQLKVSKGRRLGLAIAFAIGALLVQLIEMAFRLRQLTVTVLSSVPALRASCASFLFLELTLRIKHVSRRYFSWPRLSTWKLYLIDPPQGPLPLRSFGAVLRSALG